MYQISTESRSNMQVEHATDQFTSYGIKLCETVLAGDIDLHVFFENYFPQYYAFIDRVLDTFNKTAPSKVTCSASCGYCCDNLVAVSPLEAAYLWSQAQKLFTSSELQTITQKIIKRNNIYLDIAQQFPEDRERQGREYMSKKLGCQFLNKDNNCGVYSYRPTICRNLNVVTNPILCSDIELTGQVRVWRHPSLWKIDLKFQQLLSEYYLGTDQYAIMQSLLSQLTEEYQRNNHSKSYLH